VPACLIEVRKRHAFLVGTTPGELGGPRFGFTITKKLGNAVTRNRIRRRLKAAIAQLAPLQAQPGFDYVVVARHAAFDRPYPDIIADLHKAFAILHGGGGSKTQRAKKNLTRKSQP
jgi:ribonuclease P protein component